MRSSGGRASKGRDDWASWTRYVGDLGADIEDLLAVGFVLESLVETRNIAPGLASVAGALLCAHGLAVEIRVVLAIRGTECRPVSSAFHASFREQHRPIFRYDDAHSRAGHPDDFHRYDYVLAGYRGPGVAQWVGRGSWPSLTAVVAELRDSWESTGQFLDVP